MAAVLETTELKKYFDDVRAVDGINLEVRRGEIFGFLGPNGAGKTTTIGMVLGLIYPTAGEIRILGERVAPRRIRALSSVGALLGTTPALVPYLTAVENLSLVSQLHQGCDSEDLRPTLAQVGLEPVADRRVGAFSTGMKQRLGLAMALVHRPELLILDEPTNGMDPAGMREVRTLLRGLVAKGTTVFLSSHLLHEVEQLCDRVAVLDKGRIVAEGRVDLLLRSEGAVRVRVAHGQEAAGCLATLPGVQDITYDGATLEVHGRGSEAVVAHLTQHGHTPTEVSVSRRDLEDLFLELTADTGTT